MSEQITVTFGGQPLVLELYDPATAAQVAAAAASAAGAAANALSAEAAAAIALAAAASADYVGARGKAHRAAWLSAAGAGARLLVTADGAKTWRGGDPLTGDIVTLAPLFGPGAVLGQVGPYFDNTYSSPAAALYPRVDPAGGIVHTPTTNFKLADGVIANANGTWCVERIFRLPAVSQTYASVAAMNADAASHRAGDIAFVTGPTITEAGFGTIPTDSIKGVILNAAPDGGYYRRTYNGWESGYGDLLFLLDTTTASIFNNGEDFIQVGIDGVGRLYFYGYDGALQAAGMTSYTDVVVAPGVAHSLRVDCDGKAVRLYFDGVEFGADYRVVNFVPNAISFNGRYRPGAAAPSPYLTSGAAFTDLAVSITEGLDYTQSRAVSDALAGLFGTPKLRWSQVAYVALIDGQSEYSAPEGVTAGDGNRPDSVSNWNGLITRRATNDPRGANPSQEFIPGVFASRWRTNESEQIGPLAFPNSTYGDGSGGQKFTFSGQGETLDWGFAKQFRAWTDADLYFAGATIGGTSLAQISAKSGTYLHSLKKGAATDYGTNYRDLSNRQFLEIVDRCHERGQLVQLVLLLNAQGLTDSNTAGTAAAHATDLRQRWDEEISKVVDIAKPPLMLARAANYRGGTGLGTAVATNEAGSNYVDDEYRKLSAGKDTGHPIRALTSEWLLKGTFIHPATLMQRKTGEYLGDLTCRYAFDGEFVDPLQPLSVAIGSGGDAGKIVVTFNRPIASFTYNPTAPTTRQTGGFDTYGFVFAPTSGGRTISAAVTIAGSVAKIPISGVGPIAGDRIGYLGTDALWGNIREATTRTGLYPGQAWGSSPLASPAPTFSEGSLNEITEGAAAFTWVLV